MRLIEKNHEENPVRHPPVVPMTCFDQAGQVFLHQQGDGMDRWVFRVGAHFFLGSGPALKPATNGEPSRAVKSAGVAKRNKWRGPRERSVDGGGGPFMPDSRYS